MKQSADDVATAANRLGNMVSSSELQLATEPQLKQVMCDDRSRHILFPGNHFHMGAEMYEAHEDATETIFKDYRKTFIKATDNIVDSMSIGTMFQCPVGTGYYIDYYGTSATSVILQHLLAHFLKVPDQHKKFGGKVFLMLSFPIDADMEGLKNVLWDELGLSKHNNKIQELMMQVFKTQWFQSNI